MRIIRANVNELFTRSQTTVTRKRRHLFIHLCPQASNVFRYTTCMLYCVYDSTTRLPWDVLETDSGSTMVRKMNGHVTIYVLSAWKKNNSFFFVLLLMRGIWSYSQFPIKILNTPTLKTNYGSCLSIDNVGDTSFFFFFCNYRKHWSLSRVGEIVKGRMGYTVMTKVID